MKLHNLTISALLFAGLASTAFGQISYVSQNRWVAANWHVFDCNQNASNFGQFQAACEEHEFSASQSSTLGSSSIVAHVEIAGPANSNDGSSYSSCSAIFQIDNPVLYTITESGNGQFFSGAHLNGNGVDVLVRDGTQTGILLPGQYTFGGGACCATAIEDFSFTVVQLPTMDWSTIDCGGGSTSGGSLTLDGTIGQFDATDMLSGGSLTLTGGFWTDQTPPCPADFNHDGGIDFFDYLDFVDAFSMSSPEADFNHDSVVDFFDYLDFVDAFSIGC